MYYQKAIKTAIDLISISVRTAPKSGGVDDIIFIAASDKQKNSIAKEMVRIGEEKSKGQSDKVIIRAIQTSWSSDAKTVSASEGLILIGARGKKPFGANCGCCGFRNCSEFQAHNVKNIKKPILGPFCILKVWDLGIAMASAAKTASMLNVDNRIMYRIGIAVERLKILNKVHSKDGFKVSPVLGLPLSISGKNIYFDRFDKLESAKILTEYFKAKK